MRYEWDPAKAKANLKKHGVSFAEAQSVFGDPLAFRRPDDDEPDRLIAIGRSDRGRLLFVVAVEKTDLIRIISARRATTHERKTYEEA